MNNLSKILIMLIGWFALILGLAALFLGLYLLPTVFLGFHYEMPLIIDNLGIYLYTQYGLSGTALRVAILAPLFIGGVGFLLLSRYISFLTQDWRVDDARPTKQTTTEEPVIPNWLVRPPEKIHPLMKILIGIIIIVLLIGLAEYIVTSEYALRIK